MNEQTISVSSVVSAMQLSFKRRNVFLNTAEECETSIEIANSEVSTSW